tara:strand:- start:117 stop:440 length:324 start_codon:yes stop_codon:yes gene_type:complete
MWICDNEGFLSIVKNRNDDETLLVRARARKHLYNIFPDCELFTDADADYPFRTYIKRVDVVETIARRLTGINYDNFKDSVDDDVLHNAYSDVWREMWGSYYNARKEV